MGAWGTGAAEHVEPDVSTDDKKRSKAARRWQPAGASEHANRSNQPAATSVADATTEAQVGTEDAEARKKRRIEKERETTSAAEHGGQTVLQST